MIHPKALRLRSLIVTALVATAVMLVPAAAGATMETVGLGLWGTNPAAPITPTPAASQDYTSRQVLTYPVNGDGTITEDLKKWIVDSPAGQLGNPNAIPFEDRCKIEDFNPASQAFGIDPYDLPDPRVQIFDSNCPASAKVGEAFVELGSDNPLGPPITPGPAPAGTTVGYLTGEIFIIQTSPELPVQLATNLTSSSQVQSESVCGSMGKDAPCDVHPKTMSILAPMTNLSPANHGVTDFRVRTIPMHYSSRPAAYPLDDGSADAVFGGHPFKMDLHIKRIDQHLYGPAASGKPFLINPTRLDYYESRSYALAYDSNDGDMALDPNNPGDVFVASPVDRTLPVQTLPPFGVTASAEVKTSTRNTTAGVKVTISDPGAFGHDNVRTVVNTLPAALSVNVKALDHVCPTANKLANNCPPASQVGTATIKTPLITGGLTGKVFMVQGTEAGLPALSILVDGPQNAINFRLDASTRFVGPNVNQIETTFDTLPQAPFTEFVVDIDANNPNALLVTRECPLDGAAPQDGPVTFLINGYSPQAAVSSSPTKFDPCYTTKHRPARIAKCIRFRGLFRVRATDLIDKGAIRRVELWAGAKGKLRRQAYTRGRSYIASFRPGVRNGFSRLRGKTLRYNWVIRYRDGHVVRTNQASWKLCR